MAHSRTTPAGNLGSALAQPADAGAAGLDVGLPDPSDAILAEQSITLTNLAELRALVGGHAARLGVPPDRTDDFVLAVDELACNTVQHGGGHGVLRLWPSRHWLVCEIRDSGTLPADIRTHDRPSPDQIGGRGLWLAEALCDRLQIRSAGGGTVIRAGIHWD